MSRNPALISVWLFLVLFFCGFCHGQLWSGLLDPSRAVNWSSVGIPGGIPPRATACATVSAATYGNGSKDATAGIQNALNHCASDQTVSLSSGTFLIAGNLSIPSNVTLRGAGANQTILNAKGSGKAVITLGSPGTAPSIKSSVAITSGATQGSTTIVVSSASGNSTGSYLVITELNDSSIPVSSIGVERVRQLVSIHRCFSTITRAPWPLRFRLLSRTPALKIFRFMPTTPVMGRTSR